MFIHLGGDTVITDKGVIGIFDMDTSTVNKATRDYLSKAEKDKRILLGAAAKAYGHGGEKRIKELTGMAFSTLHRGKNDARNELNEQSENISDSNQHIAPPTLNEPSNNSCQKNAKHTGSKLKDPTKTMDGKERQRKVGAGRPSVLDIYPKLPEHIDALINWRAPTFGSPMGGKIRIDRAMSERKIAEDLLENYNENVSSVSLHYLLPKLGYSKMVNQKEKQVGEESPWRNNQFLYIAELSQDFMMTGDPIISIDTKKKEKVGEFKNNGREWCLKGLPREVLDHDFLIKELGQVAPYGVYVVNDNTGFINLGLDHDTSEFAVESIWRWWNTLGKTAFPKAKRIYINCDGGGSNGTNRRSWKVELQRFADKTGLVVAVSHYPPGASKWNKIEHRMFSYISRNWEGKPLVSVENIINLIESTTTRTGLSITCQIDTNKYELGSVVTEGMLERLKITYRPGRQGEDEDCVQQLSKWNYTIQPRNKAEQRKADKMDVEEINAEKNRIKRKYSKKTDGEN